MTAKAYASSDVFSTEELATTMSPYAKPIIDDGKLVRLWREKLTRKYTKLPGIHDLHDFVIVCHLVTGNAAMKVRQQHYQGSFEPASLKFSQMFNLGYWQSQRLIRTTKSAEKLGHCQHPSLIIYVKCVLTSFLRTGILHLYANTHALVNLPFLLYALWLSDLSANLKG